MALEYIYELPISYSAESNSTMITKRTVLFKNCTWELKDGCSGWNMNKCGNDEDYCQPFIDGDKMYLQYLIPATWTGFAAVQMIDPGTGDVVNHGTSITQQIGKDSDGLRYLNLVIDSTLLPEGVDCFYIKLTFWDCPQMTKPTPAFIQCIAGQVGGGATQAEAIITCGDQFCSEENKKEIFSEPFCLVRCEEPTLLVEGYYPGYDCEGYYYGDLIHLGTGATLTSIYALKFRIRGFIELDGYDTSETNVNGIITTISQKKKFTVYSDKIPPYVAQQIARAAGSKSFIIDSIEYTRPAQINKDFDQGLSWIPKMQVTKECSDLDLTCE